MIIIHLQASLLVLEQSGSKWGLYHEQGPHPDDPRMSGALFEKMLCKSQIKGPLYLFLLRNNRNW